MPRKKKKDRYPTGNFGADSDFRFDQIEGMVASDFSDRRRKEEYETAYEAARKLVAAGKIADEIRSTLAYRPHLQEFSPEDSARRTDDKKAHNRVEKAIEQVRKVGVEDALANRKPTVPTFLA